MKRPAKLDDLDRRRTGTDIALMGRGRYFRPLLHDPSLASFESAIDDVERMVNREVESARARYERVYREHEAAMEAHARSLNTDSEFAAIGWGWDDSGIWRERYREIRGYTGRSWWLRCREVAFHVTWLALVIGLAVFDYLN